MMIRLNLTPSAGVLPAVFALALGLAACGGSDGDSDDDSGGGPPGSLERLSGELSVLSTDDTSLENEPKPHHSAKH